MFGAIFPGQGSQQPGMGQFLFENFKSVKNLFEEASDTLSKDFKKLCFEDPNGELNLTQNTQPALVLVSTAYFKALNEIRPFQPEAFAGHSIGEYSACVASGALSLSSALRAVEKRGQWMQEAVPVGEGAMAALLGFNEEQSRAICKWAEKKSNATPVSPANFNAPGQIVISGAAKPVDYILKNLNKETWPEVSKDEPPRRMKVMPLKVSAPFHCDLMKPAQKKMEILLNDTEFEKAIAPIIQNVDAHAYVDPSDLRKNLITQVSSPVLWTNCMATMNQQGLKTVIECGHGQVLSGLNKKMDLSFETINIKTLDDLKNFENKG